MPTTPSSLRMITAAVIVALHAVPVEADDRRIFEADFFVNFAPQTALEMIEQLPGFIITTADEARGLSQNGVNILLDGKPIIGKGENPTAQLSQIAAATVLRIELIDAIDLNLPGIDGLVANVITKRTELSGSWQWQPEWRANQEPNFGNGRINLSGRRGNWAYSAALDALMIRAGLNGPETLTDAMGSVFETRNERFTIKGEQPELSGSLSWQSPSGPSFTAKAAIDKLNVQRPQLSETIARGARGLTSINRSLQAQDQTNARFDADVSLPAFGGTLKLIGLVDLQKNRLASDLLVVSDQNTLLTHRLFEEAATGEETILRFQQSWSTHNGHDWQLAGETVRNELEIETRLTGFGAVERRDPQFQIDTRDRIQEARSELTIAYSRALSSKLDFQTSIGVETSRIRADESERSFLRPKGFAALTFRPNAQWTWSTRLERTVGQINFRDFAASVSLTEEVETVGNVNLVPPQSWIVRGRAERRFGAGHVFALDISHEQISDLVDRIPIGETGDGIGNIDSARRTHMSALLTLTGDPVGLAGMRLDLKGDWRWSSVLDPVEGFDRNISGLVKEDVTAEFRHDIANTNWTYGFTLQRRDLAPLYRTNLVQFRNVPAGGLTPGENALFIERKNLLGLRARLTISELLEQESNFSRTLYSGRRDSGAIDRIEARRRDLDGPFVQLSLSGTF